MTVKKIQIKKSFEMVEIGGKEYRINFDDATLKANTVLFTGMSEKLGEYDDVDFSDSTPEEIQAYEEKSLSYLKDTVEQLLGEGTYEEVYEAAGRSSYNLADLCLNLIDFIKSKFPEQRNGG